VLDAPQPSFSIPSRRRSSRPETAKGVRLVSLRGNGQGNQVLLRHGASVKP
jgi:hypothetical protein